MSKYERMSNLEINKAVAEKLGLRSVHERGGMVCYQTQHGGSRMVDYCNSWADMGPVIDKYDIVVDGSGRAWKNTPTRIEIGDCSFDGVTVTDTRKEVDAVKIGRIVVDESPLRAAAICFLEMGE